MSQVGEAVDWVQAAVKTGWGRAILAVLVIGLSWVVGKVFIQVFGRRVARRFQRPSITRTVLRSIRVMVVVLGAFIALGLLGLRITELALSVTVFSAVLGLVLAPIVGSVVNGLFILSDQPYEIGDMVEFVDTGKQGFVEDITLRHTKVFTLENTFLVVPNSEMLERDVVNYSAEDERTRLSLDVLVTYESDLDAARTLIEEETAEVDEVISSGPDIRIGSARYPAAPTCYIDEYGDNGVNLRLRYWAKRPYRLLAIRSRVQTAVWDRLEALDAVSIAYPHRHLVFDETSGTTSVDVGSEGENPSRVGGDPQHRLGEGDADNR